MDIAAIGLKVDSSGVIVAVDKLNEFVTASQRAETASTGLARTSAQASAAAREEAATQAAITKALQSADTARYKLIEGLRQEIAMFGKSATEMKAYEAEMLGISDSTRPLIAQLEKLRAAQKAANDEARQSQQQQSFLRSLQEQSATYGKSTSEILAYRAAQLGVTQQAAPLIEKIRQEEEALKKSAVAQRGAAGAAGLHSQAMRQLPAQITDIVTSLVSGQPAYLVAIQQGGQLKDSFGGIVPAARALVSAFNPVTLALTAGAAAVGALAYGFVKGQQESSNLARTLLLTGNQVGQTVGSLNEMAKALDGIGGTRAQAAEALTALISVGRIAGEDLQRFAADAIAAQDKLGLSVEDTAKNFAALGKDPVTASLRLNEAMHYLTLETLAQITALERQGRTVDAAKLAQDSFAEALGTRAREMQQNLGYVELAWKNIKKAIAETGDALLDVGRKGNENSTIDRLIEFAKRASQTSITQASAEFVVRSRVQPAGPSADQAARQAQEEALAAERALTAEQQRAATQAQADAYTKLETLTTSLATKQEQYNVALAQTKASFEALKGTSQEKSAEEQERIIARLRESIFGRADTFGPQISEAQRALELQIDSITNAENRLETLHAARRASDEDYYAERKRLVEDSANAQVRALQAEIRILEQQAVVEDARDGRADATREKIRTNEDEITRIRQEAANKQGQITLQQQVAQEALARSYDLSRQAAENSLAVQQRALGRQLADIGSGPAARRFTTGRNQIDENFANQRSQLEAQRASNQLQPGAYEQQLGLLEDFHGRALKMWEDYYGRIEERSMDFGAGFRDAILEYMDATSNLGGMIGGDLISALDQAKNSTIDLAVNAALWGEGGENAARRIGRALITDVVSSMARVGVQYGINALLAQSAITTTAATQTAANAQVATSAAPAAAATSLASFGANSAPAIAGILATIAVAALLTKGFDTGGWTGNGMPGSAAGIVHGQEFVVRAGPAAAHRDRLEALNAGAPWMGHTGGSMQAPSLQVINTGSPMRVDRMEWDGAQLRAYVDNRLESIEEEIAAGLMDGTGSLGGALKATYGVQRGSTR